MNKKNKNSVTVMGLGYIGFPTALLLAKTGNQVTGVDVDLQKISLLKKGILPFFEPDLKQLFAQVKKDKNLQVSKDPKSSDFYIIAVPTPQQKNYRADLSYIFSALKKIESVATDGQVVIIESTVGPRDCVDKILPIVSSWGAKVDLAHCPERAIPGNTLREMIDNDRVLGGNTKIAIKKVKELYGGFVKGKILSTDLITAATCKTMENTFRAVNIALANQFTLIADELNFNVWEAIKLANHHPRVNIHFPGPGVGGHCIPIDPWFFVGSTKKENHKLIATSLKLNQDMVEYVFKLITRSATKENIKPLKLAILGLSYKKNVDDLRESPTLKLIKKLFDKKIKFWTNDPLAIPKNVPTFTLEESLSRANIAVVMVDHDQYTQINFANFTNLRLVIDARGFIKENQLGKNQQLICIGRNVT